MLVYVQVWLRICGFRESASFFGFNLELIVSVSEELGNGLRCVFVSLRCPVHVLQIIERLHSPAINLVVKLKEIQAGDTSFGEKFTKDTIGLLVVIPFYYPEGWPLGIGL